MLCVTSTPLIASSNNPGCLGYTGCPPPPGVWVDSRGQGECGYNCPLGTSPRVWQFLSAMLFSSVAIMVSAVCPRTVGPVLASWWHLRLGGREMIGCGPLLSPQLLLHAIASCSCLHTEAHPSGSWLAPQLTSCPLLVCCTPKQPAHMLWALGTSASDAILCP